MTKVLWALFRLIKDFDIAKSFYSPFFFNMDGRGVIAWRCFGSYGSYCLNFIFT